MKEFPTELRVICALAIPTIHSPALYQAYTLKGIDSQLSKACKKYFNNTSIHKLKKSRKVFVTSARLQDFGDMFSDSEFSGVRAFIDNFQSHSLKGFEISYRGIFWELNDLSRK
jgi:hypothetical protein